MRGDVPHSRPGGCRWSRKDLEGSVRRAGCQAAAAVGPPFCTPRAPAALEPIMVAIMPDKQTWAALDQSHLLGCRLPLPLVLVHFRVVTWQMQKGGGQEWPYPLLWPRPQTLLDGFVPYRLSRSRNSAQSLTLLAGLLKAAQIGALILSQLGQHCRKLLFAALLHVRARHRAQRIKAVAHCSGVRAAAGEFEFRAG